MTWSQAKFGLVFRTGLDSLTDPHAHPCSEAVEKPGPFGGRVWYLWIPGSDMTRPALLWTPPLDLLVNPSKENKGWCSSLRLPVITPVNCHHTRCRLWNACKSVFTLQLLCVEMFPEGGELSAESLRSKDACAEAKRSQRLQESCYTQAADEHFKV